jgi:hypothetical protein
MKLADCLNKRLHHNHTCYTSKPGCCIKAKQMVRRNASFGHVT